MYSILAHLLVSSRDVDHDNPVSTIEFSTGEVHRPTSLDGPAGYVAG